MAVKRQTKQKKKNYRSVKAEKTSNKSAQLSIIFLFAAGLLLTALAWIKGERFWLMMHNVFYGIFGACFIFIGISLILLAVLFSVERFAIALKHKLWQISLLFLFICSFLQVLMHPPYQTNDFLSQMAECYVQGMSLKGGGALGGVLGIPLEAAFGRVPAAVFLGICIFIFVFVVTGLTLLSFLKGVAKPVRQVEQTARKYSALKKRGSIDIPLDDAMPSHPVSAKGRFYVPDLEETPKNKTNEKKANKKRANAAKESLAEAPNLDVLLKKASSEDNAPKEKTAAEIRMPEYFEDEPYTYPPLTLLKTISRAANQDVSSELRGNAQKLMDTLKSFGVNTKIIDIARGPCVTRYELQPSAGVKISKITNLADDIALNLASGGVRIEAPIPNKAAVGIEVPNKRKEIVSLKEVVGDTNFINASSKLTFALGKDIAGNIAVADMAKMPHLLIAGSTGSGKSVCINSMIVSLLYKSSPSDLRLLMIDPKVVELGIYNGIPHLLVPVVTDPNKAAGALGWAVTEMLNRYKMFAAAGVRDLAGYHAMAKKKAQEGENIAPLPQIVIIIDELADLMMVSPKDVEDSICRLAQMARAAGMHLVIATQRPSVDVITGIIKANIPSRIAFTVSSQVDSRTILDAGGAEKLLGKGDMLFHPVGKLKPTRIQGCFVSDQEVEEVVHFIQERDHADYSEDIMQEIEKQALQNDKSKNTKQPKDFAEEDPVIPDAVECVLDAGQASTSYLQRRLKLGYARAARVMDELESRGIVGPSEGSKPRSILITKQQWLEMKLSGEQEDDALQETKE